MGGQHVYVGRKKCGCVYMAVADRGDKRTAQAVAHIVERGGHIERLDIETYREVTCKEPGFLNCQHEESDGQDED